MPFNTKPAEEGSYPSFFEFLKIPNCLLYMLPGCFKDTLFVFLVNNDSAAEVVNVPILFLLLLSCLMVVCVKHVFDHPR